MSKNEGIKFNSEDAVVIRERLIAFKTHSKGKYYAKTNRALISYIADTNFDEITAVKISKDDGNFDDISPIKEDGFGKFISRKQDNLAQESLYELYKFLKSIGYLHDFELPQFAQSTRTNAFENLVAPNDILKGEYHGVVKTSSKSYNSIYRFNKLKNTQHKYFIGFDIAYSSSEVMPVNLTSITPRAFSKSIIYGVISKGNSKGKFEALFTYIQGTTISDGAIVSDGIIKLNSLPNNEFIVLGQKPKICLGNTQFILRQFIDPINILLSNRSFPLVIKAERDIEFEWYRTGKVESNEPPNKQKASLALVSAAMTQDSIGVLEAIFNGADINFQSPADGRTALHWAMHNFDLNILNILGVIESDLIDVEGVTERVLNVQFDLQYKLQMLRQARHRLKFGIRDNAGYLPSRLLPSLNLTKPVLAGELKGQIFKHCYHEELVELLNKGEDFSEILENPTGLEPFPNLIWGTETQDEPKMKPDTFVKNEPSDITMKGETWPPSSDG